jgi:hypothetical protein
VIDCLAIFGSDFIKTRSLGFFRFLKLANLKKIPKFINNINGNKELKLIANIVFLIFKLLLYIHIAACFWYFVIAKLSAESMNIFGHRDKIWVTPTDWVNYNEPIFFVGSQDKKEMSRWRIMLYYSTLILTSNEIGP